MATLSSVLLLLLLSHFSHVQLCATPKTHSPPGSPIPGILQAKTLEWVAIAFSCLWGCKESDMTKQLTHISDASRWTNSSLTFINRHRKTIQLGHTSNCEWKNKP